ncbi:hypothetical protein VNI00_011848 [Paramarasmius palmivorus]|uniref:Uncharacterized protein n=1 Tax=Paramarasmius palmivorus TaxID=297713 RepID=A0AAW0C7N6_9AGAR
MTTQTDEEEWANFLSVSIPAHQEHFNRVIEAYPRANSTLLGSLSGNADRDSMERELFVLRNLAEFPIAMQRNTPEIPLLTQRFRKNVELVIDTISSILPPGPHVEDVKEAMRCPPGANATERNLADIDTVLLWCAEITRLKSCLRNPRGRGYEAVPIDTATYLWMRAEIAPMFGIPHIDDNDASAVADIREHPS